MSNKVNNRWVVKGRKGRARFYFKQGTKKGFPKNNIRQDR